MLIYSHISTQKIGGYYYPKTCYNWDANNPIASQVRDLSLWDTCQLCQLYAR
ncbi:hypothetical protein NIES39_O06780 [Arthrospira platensis NIES-39]|nr:hypothetical protein NIES39_O06780 [Arthrospira platensis NIES-39]